MDLEAVAFPALVIADDGWVQYLQQREALSIWTPSAIKKYNRQRVLICDSYNRVWEVESIRPVKCGSFYARVLARKTPVDLSLRPITEMALQVVCDALKKAIDADDDILTQFTTADVLKAYVDKASSFQTLVDILKSQGAI